MEPLKKDPGPSLRDLKERVDRAQKVQRMIRELEDQLLDLEDEVDRLGLALDREEADVERMKNMGFSRFLAGVTGNYYDRLDKEEQEAVEAAFAYQQAIDRVDDVRYQIDKLKQEEEDCRVAEIEYKRRFAERQREAANQPGKTAETLRLLQEQMEISRRNQREIEEAQAAGITALEALQSIAGSLNSAAGWGVFDMVGGGIIATLIKHSHIDEAKRQVARAESELRRFQTELLDIRITGPAEIQIEGFSKFADFFFDGFFMDFFMQTKINKARENVDSVIAQVDIVLAQLDSMMQLERNAQSQMQAKIEETLIV